MINTDEFNAAWAKEKSGKSATAFQNNFTTKAQVKGSSSAFAIGDASAKGQSSNSNSKAAAKGAAGAGADSDFNGHKDTKTDKWSKSNGVFTGNSQTNFNIDKIHPAKPTKVVIKVPKAPEAPATEQPATEEPAIEVPAPEAPATEGSADTGAAPEESVGSASG